MISTFPTWNLKLSLLSTDDDVDESVGGIDFHLQLLSSLLVPVDEAKPHGGGVWVQKLKLKKQHFIDLLFVIIYYQRPGFCCMHNQTATIRVFIT